MTNFKLKGEIIAAFTHGAPGALNFKVKFEEPVTHLGGVGIEDEIIEFVVTANTPANRQRFALGAKIYVSVDIEAESQT